MNYQPPWEPMTLIFRGDIIITHNFQGFKNKNIIFPSCALGVLFGSYIGPRDSLHKPIDEGSHHVPPIGTSSVHVSQAISGGIFKLWSRMTCQWSNHNPWRIHVCYTYFFSPLPGEMIQFDSYFSKWVETPPTRYIFNLCNYIYVYLLAFYPFKNQGNPM